MQQGILEHICHSKPINYAIYLRSCGDEYTHGLYAPWQIRMIYNMVLTLNVSWPS